MGDFSETFYGQQENERVLYVVRPHPLAFVSLFFKTLGTILLFIVLALILNSLFPENANLITLVSLILSLVTIIFAIWTSLAGAQKNVTYLTDRRLVRFQATTPFTVMNRSLSWQDAVKVKTFPPNFFWRLMNVGHVIVHSHSTFVTSDDPKNHSALADDDIDLQNVYYYQDLGNYIDKILYTYRQTPAELKNLHPFVPNPKGHRD